MVQNCLRQLLGEIVMLEKRSYTFWLITPAAIVYGVFFLLPTVVSFFFSLTRWDLVNWEFVGLENFRLFFSARALSVGFSNTVLYAFLTSGGKVVFGLLLGMFLCIPLKTRGFLRAMVFFPTLISMVAVGVTFRSLMHPSRGLINTALGFFGIAGPDWLGSPDLALFSVIIVDIWRGVGIATVIFIAGIMSIPAQYYEALSIDGGGRWAKFRNITLPLCRPAINTVIILSFISGLRHFELIWAMTRGGPGFSSDVISSIIYRQYAAGFYGVSTAGNVLLFLGVAVLAVPLYFFLNRKEVDL